MKQARYYETREREQVRCLLCPHQCLIGEGKAGICKIRINHGGELYLDTYGQVSSMGFDPIEKKPLYHFYPGSFIFSVGNFGCNLRCKFCQNWEISQFVPDEVEFNRQMRPDDLIGMATQRKTNVGVAYTYNEPAIWFEYMMDTAELAAKEDLKNVMVTNGYINEKPLDDLLQVMDAFNVDLKAFTEDFYHTQTMAKLEPVKAALRQIRRSGKHLEITNLLVTDKNDNPHDFEEMIKWISGELGEHTVLHLSRYFPAYKSAELPTSPDLIHEFYEMAREYLPFVYLGNINTLHEGQNTYCPGCGRKLIERSRYNVWMEGLNDDGTCAACGQKVIEYI